MNKRFLFFIGLFLLLVFLLEWSAPSKFVWKPTFSHTDEQPFGCSVFDTLLQKSIPAGYQVTRKTFPQLEREGYGKNPHAFLVQTVDFSPTATDLRAIKELLKGGSKVLIATSSMDCDSLSKGVYVTITGSSDFSPQWVQASIENHDIPFDTLEWCDQAPYPAGTYAVYSAITGQNVSVNGKIQCDTLVKCWVEDEDDDSLGGYWQSRLVSMKYGKGELFLSCEPLLLTNYGILDSQINGLIFRIMSQFRGLPVVRVEGYMPKSEEQASSPFRFFFQHRALRWAVYLALLGLLLFCVFYARRRQRVIPVVKEPDNKSLEFVRLIGTLYHQRHVNRDLLQKKYDYFCETLRRQLMIDIEDLASNADIVRQIAQHTGLETAEVQTIIDRINRYLGTQDELTDAMLRQAIDNMDKIINNL